MSKKSKTVKSKSRYTNKEILEIELEAKVNSKNIQHIKLKKPTEKQVKEELRVKILAQVAEFIIENRRIPSRSDLLSMGINKDQYRNQFGNISRMVDAVKKAHPEVKDYILTANEIFTPEMIAQVEQMFKSHKTFAVTTAVTGMPVHEGFLQALKNHNIRKSAGLAVLPTTDPAAAVAFELDSSLKGESIIVKDININDNLKISTFKTSAKQINTLTGLRRIGDREKSMIVASPKQFIEYVPVLSSTSNHALFTTGSVTKPNYLDTDHYMSMRTAWLAEQDHELGAMILEVEDDKTFHFRPVQASPDGSFTDLGTRYLADGSVQKVRPEAIILGDLHIGSLDREVYKSTDEVLLELKPKRVFLHDIFDGVSCNPHASMQNLTKAALRDKLSIEAELKLVGSYLTRMRKKHPYVEEWIVNRSNHDLFLDRYLEAGTYLTDPTNFKICHELALKKLGGEIPLKAGLEIVGTKLHKITFLNEDDSYRVMDYECGQHGHLGMNGQRNPGNSSLEIAFGKGFFGHSHTGGKLRKIFRVGTCTRMKLGYNKGASSWTHTFGAIYPDGSAQLVNIIDGKWRLK